MTKIRSTCPKILAYSLLIVLVAVISACSRTPKVDWELTITGAVSNPIVLTYEELAALPQVELNDILMEKSRGEDEIRSFSGVDLSSVLEAAGVSNGFSSITVTAADGYAVDISVDEMVGGIIALKDGGEWIFEAEPEAGPIRMVFPATPSNRWVFQVTEIRINP